MEIYDLTAPDIHGKMVDFQIFRGKVLLIVNTSINCPQTGQYAGLEKLYEKYKDRGFEILDFPCNSFGGMAISSDKDIEAFVKQNFGITFRQFARIKINGNNAHPLYSNFLCNTPKFGYKVTYNFTKFLINKKGEIVGKFSGEVRAEDLEPEVLNLLNE